MSAARRIRPATGAHRLAAGALLAALALAAAAPAAAQRPPLRAGDLDPAAGTTPPGLREVGFDQRLGEAIPLDLPFRDSAGAPVVLGELFGERPVVLSLVYFDCPMLCPMTLQGLVESLRPLTFDVGRDFDVVVVSFDPREGPGEAAPARRTAIDRYGRSGSEPGWHFLTGGEESIRRLTGAVGFRYRWDEESRQFAHAAGVVLATSEGRIARYLFGIDHPATDLRLALVEAGRGAIGGPVDQVLLYCFHYDPATGKYTAATLNLLRAAAALTLLALVGFIALMGLRERRARRLAGSAAAGEPVGTT
jgi:protein SCO1/2